MNAATNEQVLATTQHRTAQLVDAVERLLTPLLAAAMER